MALVLGRHADGKSGLLLTASYDHTVKVWVRTGDEVGGGLTGVGAGVGVAALGDGSSGGSGSGGWALVSTLTGHSDGVLALEVSRSRRLAFSGSNDCTVRVWDLMGGVCLQVLTSHESSVSALGWHMSSSSLATGAEDGVILLWSVAALEEALTAGGPSAVAGSGACCSLAQSLRIEGCEVLCIAASADGTALFAGLDDGSFALLASSGGNDVAHGRTERASSNAQRPVA